MNWAKIIRAIAPGAKASIVEGLASAMPRLIEEFEINTALRQAHFLAQLAHESAGFKTTVEYASGAAYEGRKDLGNTSKGDGVRYKGFGLIQQTGKTNQERAAKELSIHALWKKNPKILADFPYAALSAGLYWRWRNLNVYCDRDDVLTVTKKINGGTNGLSDRKTYLAKAKKILAAEGANDVGEIPVVVGEIMPRDKVRMLQEQLKKLGYQPGTADGMVGGRTVAAISEFQHDNELPVTGKFDRATEERLFTADPKPVPASRAEGVPENSTIVKESKTLEKIAAGAGVAGGAGAVAEPLQQLESVGQTITNYKSAFLPFQEILTMAQDHWYVGVMLAAGVVYLVANKIKKARIEDHRTGKTA